jgi:ATP-dependent Clp protease ATP-binding subunit ClpB
MNLDQLTNASQQLINTAAQIAIQHDNPILEPLHTLYAGLGNNFYYSFFETLQVPLDQLHMLVEQETEQLPRVPGARLSIDYSMQDFFAICQREAESLGDHYISLEHILIAWITTDHLPDAIKSLFARAQITREKVLSYMKKIRHGSTVQNKQAEGQYQVLQKYCINITQQAKKANLIPLLAGTKKFVELFKFYHAVPKIIRFWSASRELVKQQL